MGVQTENTPTNDSGNNGLVCKLVDKARMSGPGWLLSAYTLGSGTAITSVLIGSQFGYDLLWVNPISMLMGVLVLTGAAYFALSSEKSPFQRFKTELHPAVAYAWGIGSLLASVIWHLPQYGMSYALIRELGGFEAGVGSQVVVGAVILVVSLVLTWQYRQGTGLLIYESIMKGFIWLTIICLGILMIKLPIDWSAVGKGFAGFKIPAGSNIYIFALLGAAVGINMTFLYPYSIRCKGWGAAQTKNARNDLFTGMFLPFVLATAMLMIACAATLHASGTEVDRSAVTQIGNVFAPVFGKTVGPVLFYLGLLAMPLATITLHMLTSGFIISEMTGTEQGSTPWKIGTLIPAIGVLGVAYPLPVWLPIPTSALCLILIPIAYISFAVLVSKDTKKPGAARYPGGDVGKYLMFTSVGVMTAIALINTVIQIKKLF